MTSLGSVCREKINAAANQLGVDTEIVRVTDPFRGPTKDEWQKAAVKGLGWSVQPQVCDIWGEQSCGACLKMSPNVNRKVLLSLDINLSLVKIRH